MSHKYNSFSLYLFYAKFTMKAWFQYKVNACIQSLTVFLRESTTILVMYLTLLTFTDINGWNRNELFFLFSLIYITYGILVIFCTGLRDFDNLIVNGTFDRFLLRPQGLLFQVLASNSDWFAAIGHGGLGIILFVMSANKLGIVWNVKTVIYYVCIIIFGTMIQVAIFLLFAALSFYTIKTDSVKFVLYWEIRKFAGYPISIFSKVIQVFLIGIVPFAFVNYFPAQFLLRKEDMKNYPSAFLFLTPVVAIVFVLLAYLFWKASLKHYSSSGN